ncbi:MAG TPA: winged helix-turn-helix domain-containing protein, partial [Candidatus Fimenecus excrementigallinarum]|nr:winged helix-turn-helix domain-containing protein [Candidatus Fimenecus excrementigallinarum]
RVLSYRQLYEAVWGEDPMGNEANAVSCHVYGLRRKFREIALSLYKPISKVLPAKKFESASAARTATIFISRQSNERFPALSA